jgi:ribose 5-phosphate isomerase B
VKLKEELLPVLQSLGHEVADEGICGSDSVDYPDLAALVARKVSQGQAERGLLLCGTGIGMAIAANKFSGVRAAVVDDEQTARISRQHNDLNVLCLSGDAVSGQQAQNILRAWLETPFEGGRHARRLEKIAQLEREGCQS